VVAALDVAAGGAGGGAGKHVDPSPLGELANLVAIIFASAGEHAELQPGARQVLHGLLIISSMHELYPTSARSFAVVWLRDECTESESTPAQTATAQQGTGEAQGLTFAYIPSRALHTCKTLDWLWCGTSSQKLQKCRGAETRCCL
jgi:hypothetical protein